MKKFFIPVFYIILSILITSCSIFDTNEYEEQTISKETNELDPQLLINNLMEEARLKHLDALANQNLGFTKEAIAAYEDAVGKINRLSYFPNMEDNTTFSELENAIIEDYQKFIDNLDELPEGVSISAFEEWANNKIPEFILEDITREEDSLNSAVSDIIVVGDFPLEVNKYVEQYIEYFTGRGRNTMEVWLERSGKYFPMMAKTFKEENAPQQLIFLSMMESGLNPTARSWARAVGLWQFVKATGKAYDLKSDFYVDERRDPEKATRSAARYLRDMYISLDDWYAALAGYNCGEGRVRRSMRKAGSENFWKYRRFLPKETRNYVPQYIAVTLIGSNPAHYGFENIRYQRALETETYEIDEPIDLSVLAKCAGIELSLMKDLNPELTQHHTPPHHDGGYPIKVPAVTSDYFVKNLELVPSEAKLQYVIHTVRSGETLSGIAYKYKVQQSQMARVNNISVRSKIHPKQKLKIPISNFKSSDFIVNTDEMPAVDELTFYEDKAPYKLQITTNSDIDKYKKLYEQILSDSVEVIFPKDKELVNYTVKRGDNLVNIADIFNIRVSELRNWNNVPYTSSIYVGQKLNIYVNKDKQEYYSSMDKLDRSQKLSVIYGNSGEEWIKHKIRRGQTLSHIALKYHVSVKNLKKWNNLRSSKINVGKRLHIYVGSSKSVAAYTKSNSSSKSVETVPTGKHVNYKIRKGDTVSEIAESYGVSSSQLRRWNNLKNNKIVVGKTLKVYGKNVSSNPVASTTITDKGYSLYIIKPGDTVGQIAENFKVSSKQLRAWNNITRNKIIVGKKLKIFPSNGSNTKTVISTNDKTPVKSGKKTIYAVKSGDTLGQIAVNHNVRSSAEIKKWNNITNNKIKVGQELILYPGVKTIKSVVTKTENSKKEKSFNGIHKVKEGESLWTIARHYDIHVKEIMDWNNLEDDKIRPGTDLKILNYLLYYI
ncbi:MAG: LysM peptidoglycan-binding domain-containing protein [Melioribacteraceae bacterium]|nr:LysM peptidoglycan-binding domain-containing protein [Melioribacteraceae bacterium]